MNTGNENSLLSEEGQFIDMKAEMEDFLKSTGMGSNEQVKQASEIITKNTTIQAKLIGYKQTKTDAVSMDGKYQFYVLIEYPVGDANKALLNQIKICGVNADHF